MDPEVLISLGRDSDSNRSEPSPSPNCLSLYVDGGDPLWACCGKEGKILQLFPHLSCGWGNGGVGGTIWEGKGLLGTLKGCIGRGRGCHGHQGPLEGAVWGENALRYYGGGRVWGRWDL